MRPFIKISQIRDLTSARYFASAGAEWLGFDLNAHSESQVALAQIQEIRQWIAGVRLFADLRNRTSDEVEFFRDELGLEGVAIDDMQYLPGLSECIVFLHLEVSDKQLPLALPDLPGQTMLEISTTATFAKTPTFREFINTHIQAPWILDLGVEWPSLLETLPHVEPDGINITAPVELRPGMQDFTLYSELFHTLHASE